MSVDIKFIPLSFINTDYEIIRQIKNTVVFSFLFNQHGKTSLDYYLETTQYGYTASASESGTHRLLRITDINSGNVNWETVPYCNCDSDDKYLLKDNDILVARTGGTTGKSFLVLNAPSKAVFASYLIRLRLKSDVNIDFINYFLNSYTFWSQIIEMKSGSAMPNVNAEKLKTLKLPKCDFDTQNKIVAALNNNETHSEYALLFQKIASVEGVFNNGNQISTELTHQLDLVKKLRQQFLQEAVQGILIKNNEGVGETGAELLKRIKAEKAKTGKKEKPLLPISKDEIPFDIPDNWVWCRLGEVELFSDYGTSQKADLNTDDIPVLRMGNIQNSKVILENLKYVKSTIDDLPKLYLKKGDLLFNRTNSFELVGKSGIFEGNDDTFTFASYLIRIKFTNLISSEYINFWINSKMCRITQIEPNTIQQNGQANFNGTKLKNILIPLPPLSIQAKIVTKLEQLMGLCTALEGQIQASQVQNEQLLQQVLREALAG